MNEKQAKTIKIKSRISLLPCMLAGLLVLSACQKTDTASEGKAPANTSAAVQTGGTLNIAYPAQAQTLDPVITTNQSTRDIARQIFETLVTLNQNYEVVPMLAESYETSQDGRTVTFHLRKGVKFHNGKEMTSEDVVASMNRWLTISTTGKANLSGAKFVAVDPYTAQLQLQQPSLLALHILADAAPFPAIMPKEVVEEADPKGVKTYIGTGPFKLEEWKQDQFVHLKKFADYSSLTTPSNGLGGKKEALVDDIYFKYVTDESTRVAGISTGEYDVAFSIPYDSAKQLENTSGVHNFMSPGGMTTFVLNKKARLFANVKARQAVNAALDMEEILTAAYKDKKFYSLEPGLALPEQTDWYSKAGQQFYNQHNPEKAKQLLQEAGYNGEELVILTTRDYPDYYDAAVVAQQQLQKIGMKVKLDIYDWVTFQKRRMDEKAYDMFVVGFAVRPTLHQYPFLDSRADYPGWTNNPKLDKLLDDIQRSPSIQAAKPLVDQLQAEVWDDLPIIKIGNKQDITAISDRVKGFSNVIGPIFWNVSISK
jgi:peptide/nickel transport system substrate-binding protein